MRKLIVPALFFLIAGCDDGQAVETPSEPMAAAGDEAAPVEAAAPAEPASEEPPAATGPARLTVQARIDGEDAGAKIQLVNAEGEVIHEGPAGRAVSVPAGQYDIVAQVADAAVLVDEPTRRVGRVFLEPGDEVTEEVEIGRARVRLRILKAGREVRNARVELRPSGSEEVVYEYEPGKEHIGISPGRYDAKVHLPKTEVEVSGLIFQPGAKQSIPIRVE